MMNDETENEARLSLPGMSSRELTAIFRTFKEQKCDVNTHPVHEGISSGITGQNESCEPINKLDVPNADSGQSGNVSDSKGTTPQAERPKFDDLCDRCITATHCILNGCCLAESRAVAPVETQEKCARCQLYHDRNHTSNAGGKWESCRHPAYLGTDHCEICQPNQRTHGTEKCPCLCHYEPCARSATKTHPDHCEGCGETVGPAVETRLTAEELAVQIVNKFTRLGLKGRTIDWEVIEDEIQTELEAFRDKSEAGLRDETCAHSMFHKGCYACAMRDREGFGKNAKGLREEIERLKADHQVEIARYRNTIDLMSRRENGEVWCWADDGEDHPETLACPALIQPDVVRRFVAAEAEAAALRERERWISVEDKLPEENVRVRIWYMDTGKEWRERYGDISCGHWRPEGGNGNFDDRVTHWKALSAAPERGKDGI